MYSSSNQQPVYQKNGVQKIAAKLLLLSYINDEVWGFY
jgi:hypothetical protein